MIPAEAAIYQSQALLPPTRSSQASAVAAAAAAAATPAVTYYPTQAAQLYMNYTAYYPRYYPSGTLGVLTFSVCLSFAPRLAPGKGVCENPKNHRQRAYCSTIYISVAQWLRD